MKGPLTLAASLAVPTLALFFLSATPAPVPQKRVEGISPISVANDGGAYGVSVRLPTVVSNGGITVVYDGGSYGLSVPDAAFIAPNYVDNSKWISGNYQDGGFAPDAFYEAVSEDQYVYVLSNIYSAEFWPQETHADDSTATGTKRYPFLSFTEAVRRTGLKFIEGKRVVFMLGGGQNYQDRVPKADGGFWTDGGLYDGLAREPVNDPWDDQAVELRQYIVRSIQVGGSEAHWQSWAVRGPRKMMRIGAQPTITDFTYVRDPFDGVTPVGRTQWRYVGNTDLTYENDGAKGFYLRITRDGGNGRIVETSHPVQITGSASDSPGSVNGYLYTDHGNYYHGQGIYDRDVDQFEIVVRGAEFIPTAIVGDTGGADGIAITGFGSFDDHNRLSQPTGRNEGVNPIPTFERVGFENAQVDAIGVWFDMNHFYHSASFRGRLHFSGNTISSTSDVNYNATSILGGFSVNASQEINQFCARAVVALAVTPDAGVGDPVRPDICGQSIYGVSGNGGGGKFLIGSDHAMGDFRVWKGFTWEGGVEVRGPGSRFVMPDISHTVHIPDATIGLWARNGAQVFIDPHTIFFGYGSHATTSHLKVGRGATIQLGGAGYPARSSIVPSLNAADDGTFVYGPKWNGNFSRHLESHTADSGYLYPDGDSSAIRDSRVWWIP